MESKAEYTTDRPEPEQLAAAYNRGYNARLTGIRYTKGPYDYYTEPDLSDYWCNGWLDADAHGNRRYGEAQ